MDSEVRLVEEIWFQEPISAVLDRDKNCLLCDKIIHRGEVGRELKTNTSFRMLFCSYGCCNNYKHRLHDRAVVYPSWATGQSQTVIRTKKGICRNCGAGLLIGKPFIRYIITVIDSEGEIFTESYCSEDCKDEHISVVLSLSRRYD